LIVFTPRAGRQVRELQEHCEDRGRPEASRALAAALESAWQTITTKPEAGLAAPRPYPALARRGRAWVKAGRYWVAYRTTQPPAIVAVFFETANIPGRL
jgi:plasmid stabilization system protein ParE